MLSTRKAWRLRWGNRGRYEPGGSEAWGTHGIICARNAQHLSTAGPPLQKARKQTPTLI